MSLLAVPLNVQVLRALADGPMPLVQLRRVVGAPPQTTMRVQLRALTEAAILERDRQQDFPGSVCYRLTPGGKDLVALAEVVQHWLKDSPDPPIDLGTPAAKSVLKAALEAWSTSIVRALAAKPLCLTDLSQLIPGISYPSLERRLSALRLAGLIEASSGGGRGTPYRPAAWLRRFVIPLMCGTRWERRYAAEVAPPVRRMDVEAALLLIAPLLRLAADQSGSCRVAVELASADRSSAHAGGVLGFKQGRLVSCISRLEQPAEGWASGGISAWMDALIEGDFERLEIGGDGALALNVLDAMNNLRARSKGQASLQGYT